MTVRRAGFMASTVLLMAVAILLIPTTLPPIPTVHASTRTITLTGGVASGWNNSQPGPPISVVQGDAVTMQLFSGDSSTHKFLIDVDHDGAEALDCPATDPCSPTFSQGSPTSYPLTVNFSPGTYTYYCIFHSGSMSGTFVVQSATAPSQDFSIDSNPTTLDIAQGSTASTTITLTSANGFSGTLNLTGTVSPSGPAISFIPASIIMSSGGTATSTLTVSAPGGLYSSVAIGNYSVSVKASNGTLSHSTTVQVTVGPSNPSPNGSASLPVTVLVATAVGVIAAVAVTVFVLRRKSK